MNKIKYVLFVSVICLVFVTNSIVAKADVSTITLQEILQAYFNNDNASVSGVIEDNGVVHYLVWENGQQVIKDFPEDFDKNGDGLIKIDDIEYILTNVDTSYMYDIKGELDGNTHAQTIAYRMVNEKFNLGYTDVQLTDMRLRGVGIFDDVISIDTITFFENYSFLVCMYSLCSGESINTLRDGELFLKEPAYYDAVDESGLGGEGLEVAIGNCCKFVGNSMTSVSGYHFPGDVEEADENWYSNTGNQNPEDQSQTSEEQFVVQDDASDWLRDIVETDMRDDGVLLPDGSDLTSSDKVQLGLWLTSVQFGKEDSWFQTLRVVRIIVGIICIVYSVLFFLCYWLDKVNNIFDISFLGLISLGRFVASADDGVSTYRGKSKEPKLLSLRDVLMVSIGILLLGVLILTGTLYIIVVTILDKLNSLLGGL